MFTIINTIYDNDNNLYLKLKININGIDLMIEPTYIKEMVKTHRGEIMLYISGHSNELCLLSEFNEEFKFGINESEFYVISFSDNGLINICIPIEDNVHFKIYITINTI